MNTKLKTSLLALCITSALSACGGGGGGAPTTSAKPAVTVSGSVSGFGSVIVNGVRYETGEARLVSDDTGETLIENPTNDQLKAFISLGDVVGLRGGRDDNGGVATTIVVDNELVGTLTSLDDASLTLKVMGQTISVTANTIIDDSLLADSAVDAALGSRLLSALLMTPNTTVLEISGHPGANGIEATRIESSTADPVGGQNEAEVKGTVANLGGNTFKINDLTVDFSGVSVTLADGNFVEVKGSFDGTSTLTASSIELEDGAFEDEGEVEVEGVIQTITAGQGTAGSIKVNGFTFQVADISQYSVGMKIEIKARNQNGTLSVTRIQDETEDSIRIQDKVTGKTANSITTRLGTSVMPSDRSRIELDNSNPDSANLLTNIQAGNYIKARGFLLNGSIVWTRIEASSDSKEQCRLRGAVSNISSGNSFDIQNVTVTVANAVLKDANGAILDNATFFNELADGIIVEAKSPSNGAGCAANSLSAKEVSFEPGDDVLENNGTDDNGGNGNDDAAENESKGAVSNVTTSTFVINGETITVENGTMIDNSLIEAALGGPELPADKTFADSGATLTQLLKTDGTIYVVTIDRSGSNPVATLIEDF